MYSNKDIEILDNVVELPLNICNSDYYSGIPIGENSIQSGISDINSEGLIPQYYQNNDNLRCFKQEISQFELYNPLHKPYEFTFNPYYLDGYNNENYNLNTTFDLNTSLEYNKTTDYPFNNTFTNIPTHNIFNYNQSIKYANDLYQTHFLSQISGNYTADLYGIGNTCNQFVNNTQPQIRNHHRLDEIPNSSDSETDYEGVENMANIDFLNMSERAWEKCRLSGMLRLGNKGRSQLKSKISKYLKKNPHMRSRVNKISGVRKATTRQLFQLAQICGITSHLTRNS